MTFCNKCIYYYQRFGIGLNRINRRAIMKSKFKKAIEHVVNQLGGFERTPTFVNKVSEYANKKYGLNAAATTAEHNALIAALDEYEAE